MAMSGVIRKGSLYCFIISLRAFRKVSKHIRRYQHGNLKRNLYVLKNYIINIFNYYYYYYYYYLIIIIIILQKCINDTNIFSILTISRDSYKGFILKILFYSLEHR